MSTTYALLIYRTAPAEPTPEAGERALVGHRALQAEAAASGDLHAGRAAVELDGPTVGDGQGLLRRLADLGGLAVAVGARVIAAGATDECE